MRTRVLTIALSVLAGLQASKARAQASAEDDLGEAAGLAPSTSEPLPAKPPGGTSGRAWRAYALLDWRWRSSGSREDDAGAASYGPNGEIGAAASAEPGDAWTVFAEGRGVYDDETERSQGLLDQGGGRWRPSESVLLVLGKERNRRAPGLIVSPSDFLHSSQSAPGLREERRGVWLGRLAWQTEAQSADVIALPVSKEKDTGLPAEDSEYAGTAIRYFARLPRGVDLGVDMGRSGSELKAGAFLQTIAWNVWKLYGETGYDGASESGSHLLGLSYEGSSTYVARAEWYGRDRDWLPPSPLFADRAYAILSVGAVELADTVNLTGTLVRSLETTRFATVTRAEWLVGDRHVVGATLVRLEPGEPFQGQGWQGTADWKVSL